jgi:hypothetical protein
MTGNEINSAGIFGPLNGLILASTRVRVRWSVNLQRWRRGWLASLFLSTRTKDSELFTLRQMVRLAVPIIVDEETSFARIEAIPYGVHGGGNNGCP